VYSGPKSSSTGAGYMALDRKFGLSTMVLPWAFSLIKARQAKGSAKDNTCCPFLLDRLLDRSLLEVGC